MKFHVLFRNIQQSDSSYTNVDDADDAAPGMLTTSATASYTGPAINIDNTQ